MESSWVQLLVLSGWYTGSFKRMARLLAPIGPVNVVVEAVFDGGYGLVGCVLDTEGYFAGVLFFEPHAEPGFPWGYEVYGDDVFPVPWP